MSSIADRLFAAKIEYGLAEEAAYEAILRAAGVDPEEPGTWPCSDFTYDDYDYSFEFKGTKGDWTPTPDILSAWWALGFERCWICYDDGTERYCCSGSPDVGDRRKRR